MTIHELLETRAEKDGENPFVHFLDQTVSFAALNRKANRVAEGLRKLGIRKGSHVCLFLPNSLEFLYISFGLAKAGGVMVPLNPVAPTDDLKYIINHSDAETIVVDRRYHDIYALIERDLPGIEQTIWHGDEIRPAEGFYSLHDLMGAADEKNLHIEDVKDEDPLGIFYTPGIEGPPKGVMISHSSYVIQARVWTEDIVHCREDDVFFTSLALFRIAPQVRTMIAPLVSGRPCVLQAGFQASGFFDKIRHYRATVFDYTGHILSQLMAEPYQEHDAENPARLACGSGASPEIWKDFEERFQVGIIESYGLTETGGFSLSNLPDNRKIGSIGKPTRFCDVMIWDENNQEIPTGQAGEIVIREEIPHSMFLRYYKQPDKSLEARDGGALHTGDIGYKDGDGFFYFVGRTKDCIRRGGEVISLVDIEKIVNSHPKVLKSAAVVATEPSGQEDLRIYAVLRENETLDPQELVVFCQERMASSVVPRCVEFRGELPKSMLEETGRVELS
jgi:crotonobetaine/carnitine-CoA ligase